MTSPSLAPESLGELDRRILLAVDGSPIPLSVAEVVTLVFPTVRGEVERGYGRVWEAYGGIFASPAALVWERLRRLDSLGLLYRETPVETDRFRRRP